MKGKTHSKGDELCVRQSGYQYDIQIGKIFLLPIGYKRRMFVDLQVLETLFLLNIRVYEIRRVLKYQGMPWEQMIIYVPLHSYNIGHFQFFKTKYGFVAHVLRGDNSIANIKLYLEHYNLYFLF